MTAEEERRAREELRARGHDDEFIDQWIANEKARRESERETEEDRRYRDVRESHSPGPEDERDPSAGTPWGGGGEGDGSRQSGFDSDVEDVFLLGSVTGANQRQARRRGEHARQRREDAYGNLYGLIPGEVALEQDSEAARAVADQQSIDAQRRALELMGTAAEGRYSDIDRARQEQMLSRNAMQERAQREAALSQMQARGMGRSGTANVSAQMAAQQGANRASSEAMNLEALAQQRALQAMNSMAGTAGQMRGQSFDEQYRTGSARDEFNRRNVDRRNQFNQQQFQNRQGVTDRATGVISEIGSQAAAREAAANQEAQTTGLGILELADEIL